MSTFQWIELHMPTTFLGFITTKRISWFTQDFMILIEKIWLTSTMATGHKDIFRFADDAKYCLTHKFPIVHVDTLCHKLWKWKKKSPYSLFVRSYRVNKSSKIRNESLEFRIECFGLSKSFQIFSKTFLFDCPKIILRNLKNLQNSLTTSAPRNSRFPNVKSEYNDF